MIFYEPGCPDSYRDLIYRKKGKYYITDKLRRSSVSHFIHEIRGLKAKIILLTKIKFSLMNSKIFHHYSETLHCYRYSTPVTLAFWEWNRKDSAIIHF